MRIPNGCEVCLSYVFNFQTQPSFTSPHLKQASPLIRSRDHRACPSQKKKRPSALQSGADSSARLIFLIAAALAGVFFFRRFALFLFLGARFVAARACRIGLYLSPGAGVRFFSGRFGMSLSARFLAATRLPGGSRRWP